jgi:hypothetical protein
MSKYKLGDQDYVIPGNPEEQTQWEIGRLRERVAELEGQRATLSDREVNEAFDAYKERVAELEASRKFLIEDQALLTNERADLHKYISELEGFIRKIFSCGGIDRALPSEWIGEAWELLAGVKKEAKEGNECNLKK